MSNCTNQVIRFGLSDASATAPLGITIAGKIDAGQSGLFLGGSNVGRGA